MIELDEIGAMADMLQQLAGEADAGMAAEPAIARLEALAEMETQLKAAKAELKAQALRGLETGEVVVNGKVWRRVRTVKKRADHERIGSLVAKLAAKPDQNSEFPSIHVAVDRAVAVMKKLYVAPSDTPKVGGMKVLGIYLDDYSTEERGDDALESVEIPT